MDSLKEVWIKHGYPSANKLFLIVKDKTDFTMKDIDTFVSSQKTHQLHKKASKGIQGHIVAFCKDCMWFADLLDMSNYSRQNKGFKWILLCVDTFTRKGYATGLKSKSKLSAQRGFDVIMSSHSADIKLIITDSGSEFLNRPVQDLFKELEIEHRTVDVGDHNALGIIDRLSRTIKEMIFKDFTERGNVDWIDRLQNYVDAYNSNPNRGILNLTPDQAASGKHNEELIELNIEKNTVIDTRFKIGDHVRKRLKKAAYQKGYKQIWGDRVYEITEIIGIRAKLGKSENKVRLDDLQLVPDADIEHESVEHESKVSQADKAHKIERTIKKEGLDPANILTERTRKN